MATQAQLVRYVLWRLRARASGQQPLTEDSEVVEEILAWKLGELAERRIIYIPDSDDIPDAAVEWVGRLVEQTVASGFGQPEDGAAIQYAEAMLRDLQPAEATETTRFEDF